VIARVRILRSQAVRSALKLPPLPQITQFFLTLPFSPKRMGTPAFDTHAIVCPHCARPSRYVPDEPLNGLYTCPNCKTRLVVCWSGHFVRDPATSRYYDLTRSLRRTGQPLKRALRDIGIMPIVGLISAIALGGLALANGFGQLPSTPDSERPTRSSLEPRSSLPQPPEAIG
jgi:hypothetical protein